MKNLTLLLLTIVLCGATAFAGNKPKVIGMKRAQAIATAKAPGLVLKAKELENEKGIWIYSFEFKNKNGSIREVNVNARTGKIVGVEHENAKGEAREEKAEKKGKH